MKKGDAVVGSHFMFENNLQEQKCGIATIVGYPNSGKSTLINQLIGYKVSIVTHKVQTTRRQIQGVLTEDHYQAILIDTPGIFEAKKPLEKALVDTAYRSFKGVDQVILVIDIRHFDATFLDKIKKMAQNKMFILVFNKIDLVEPHVYKDLPGFKISAKTGEGVEVLKKEILHHMPSHPFMYDPDQLTNLNQKIWVSEITREKIMLNLHQELPYEIYVETERYKETSSNIEIHQVIVVSRDGLKGIVLGAKGSMIKKIGTQARQEIETYLCKKTNLFLHVKVQDNWQEKRRVLQELGVV